VIRVGGRLSRQLESKWKLTLLGVRPVFREGDVLLLVGADARLAAFTK